MFDKCKRVICCFFRSAMVVALMVSAFDGVAQKGAIRYKVVHEQQNVNTKGAETGGIIVDDTLLLYTTMYAESTNNIYLMDFSPVLMQVFQAPVSVDGAIGQGESNRWGMNTKGEHCGNVAYDKRNDVLYFTRSIPSSDEVYLCQIYYMRRSHGKWEKPKRLGGNVNLKGYTSTHPAIGYLPEGKSILYFSSNRPGGLGGMDLWYAVLLDYNRPGNCINMGMPVNGPSDDVTPFYDTVDNVLYFSSDREGGNGGFDVYQSVGSRNSWTDPENLGSELNSKYNDVYFTMIRSHCDLVEETQDACGFVASNRHGSYFKVDSNCCNDLFHWYRYYSADTQSVKKNYSEGRNGGMQKNHVLTMLPLSLYFDNDQPSPNTYDTNTMLDYATTAVRYNHLRDEYLAAQPQYADAGRYDSVISEVNRFFDHGILGGQRKLEVLQACLFADLKAGRKVRISVESHASPLHSADYNTILCKRRICSFVNQLSRWNDGSLVPYLSNGSLVVESENFGAPNEEEVPPSSRLRDPEKPMSSVYSIEAAHERRIDVVNYSYFEN